MREKLEAITPILSRTLEKARELGADAEIKAVAGKSIHIKTFEQALDGFDYNTSMALGIRVVNQKHEGVAYTERINEDAVLETLYEAIANAEVCEPKPFAQIATPPPCPPFKDFYEPELDAITPETLRDASIEMEKIARERDSRIVNIPHAGAGYHAGAQRIVSTTGTDVMEAANHVSAYLYVLGDDGKEKRLGGASRTGMSAQIDTIGIANEAVDNTVALLNSEPIPVSGEIPVLFFREAWSDLLGAFLSAFSAKEILEGRSPLKNKLGETLSSPILSLIDDPRAENASSRSFFDDEGFPVESLALIENGVLQNIYHNSQTAAEMGVPNNARAARSIGGSLGVSGNALCVKISDTLPMEKLMARYPEIIYVYNFQGLHAGVNAISGDFSLMAEGFYYKDGVRQFSLKPFTVSGNFWKMLNALELGAEDAVMLPCDTYTPSLLVKSLSVSG